MIDHYLIEEKKPVVEQSGGNERGLCHTRKTAQSQLKARQNPFPLSLSSIWQNYTYVYGTLVCSKKFVHARPNNLRYKLSQNFDLLSIKRDDPCPQFRPKGMCTSKELFPSYKPFQIRIGIRKYVFLFSKPGNGIEGLKIRG